MISSILTAAALASAPAPGDTLDADLRCVMALSILADEASKEDADGIGAAVLYFLGKIDGRAPGIDLTAALEPIAENADFDAAAESGRCGEELSGRGSELDAISKAAEEKTDPAK